ncbi:MAG: SEL1-like repeat protein [Proteobacteria bacterium]|nr:SEL1-like repeat protein [Pseudomonadota bacterium]
MIAARAALIAALLVASAAAHSQQGDASDVAAPLRPAVMAYRQGNVAAAEQALRSLRTPNADADAWLGAILIERGATAEGLRLIQRAADAGSSEGQHRLGLIYARGDAGQTRNDARAAELFAKAAEQGHRRAQTNLGLLYLRGQGVPRDLVQARAWLEKAASDGDPYAMYALGRAMDDSAPPVAADATRAADLFRRAAEKGHPLAALRYGLALSEGAGVKKDLPASHRWLVQAQENGVPEAALALGDIAVRMPLQRDKATNDKALKIAIAWYETAANGGVPSAQFKLANAYLGGVGVPRDPAQAQLWYTRAAQQGLGEAQQALGVLLLSGAGGATDPAEGYKWLLLAERSGRPDASAAREKLADKASDRDRRRAEALAQAFKPTSELPRDDGQPRLMAPRR